MGFLHLYGSSAPEIEGREENTVEMYPFFFLKDTAILLLILNYYVFLVFFYPDFLNHSDNFIQANPFVTPLHIQPEWYFLPLFCVLRSLPNKTQGII
jgi:ubiquinol-cytochrome c reductase cytochrome b subunit